MDRQKKPGDDFKSVYETVFPIIIRIAYRITNDLDVAEEVCQEAFIRYYERGDAIPDAEQAKFWLIRVCKNLSLNYEKRKGRERRAYERVFREPKRTQDTGETLVLKDETSEAVQQALAALPEKLRIVLVLKEYANLSYKEIAAVVGISEGNVKVRVFRARERLADFLKEGGANVP
ncbi:MAG TPA: RNA polymerase sigma factor [Spirochaetia bacterium]|nr:RNA polymerase sigma factor [Spirochaetia bacterium]